MQPATELSIAIASMELIVYNAESYKTCSVNDLASPSCCASNWRAQMSVLSYEFTLALP